MNINNKGRYLVESQLVKNGSISFHIKLPKDKYFYLNKGIIKFNITIQNNNNIKNNWYSIKIQRTSSKKLYTHWFVKWIKTF